MFVLKMVTVMYQAMPKAAMAMVPNTGVWDRGFTRAKALGREPCAATESVERERGSSVVRDAAGPDVKMASMTRRNKMRPASDGPPTAATSGVKTSAALVVKNALPANAWHAQQEGAEERPNAQDEREGRLAAGLGCIG